MARRSTDSVPQVSKRPSLDFSFSGLIYSTMMMFMGLAAVNTQANLLFGVFGLMIGVMVVAWLISGLVIRRLTVERVLPDFVVVGQAATLQYRFTNPRRFWPSFSITLSEIDGMEAFFRQAVAYMLHAAPRMVATVPIEVIPRRRGRYALDRFQLSTSFPFGFIKRAMDRRIRQTILIFPAIGQVDPELLALCLSADQTGASMRPRRGGEDEFYGVREYRAGENPRHIYWRRSAKTGVLVSKEMTRVSPPRLILLVDTSLREGNPADPANVERAIAMAASLASHALEAGLMVGLFTWSGQWLYISPSRGKQHRRDLLAQLAQLPRNPFKDTQAMLDSASGTFAAGATPILLTPHDIQVGLAANSRRNLLVVSATSSQAQAWFSFDPAVDFQNSAPMTNETQTPPNATESPGRAPVPGPATATA